MVTVHRDPKVICRAAGEELSPTVSPSFDPRVLQHGPTRQDIPPCAMVRWLFCGWGLGEREPTAFLLDSKPTPQEGINSCYSKRSQKPMAGERNLITQLQECNVDFSCDLGMGVCFNLSNWTLNCNICVFRSGESPTMVKPWEPRLEAVGSNLSCFLLILANSLLSPSLRFSTLQQANDKLWLSHCTQLLRGPDGKTDAHHSNGSSLPPELFE